MPTSAVVYVAYGQNARAEAAASIKTLRHYHKRIPVYVVGDAPIDGGAKFVKFNEPGAGARWAKLNIDRLIDSDQIIYLDADTRILDSLTPAIEMLDNWDLVMAYSVNQDGEALSHIGSEERAITLTEVFYPLQLQAGFMVFNRLRCLKLFDEWRRQWQRWQQQDQAALLRALNIEPVKVWVLGQVWNSANGEVVQHLFGRAR